MSKLQCGFLGVGSMGRGHVKVVAEHFAEVAEVAAICDPHQPSLELGRAEAPAARAYADVDQFLADESISCVIISTPGSTHADLAEACLKAGKHVLAEKPVMTTRAGCAKMMKLAARHPGQVLMIGLELRYSQYFGKIKELIDAGAIGRPQMVGCKEFRRPFHKKINDWIQDARRSGGALVEKNCHHFDLLNWWIGSRPARVCGFGGTDIVHVVNNEHEVIDHASVSFEYENGTRGGLELCMFAPPSYKDHLQFILAGEEGLIQTAVTAGEIHLWKRSADVESEPTIFQLGKSGVGWGGHLGTLEMHEAFFDGIRTGRAPLTSVPNCVDGTLLAIAAEEAIAGGQIVKL